MKPKAKRSARALDSSATTTAPKRHRKSKHTSESAKPADGLYRRVDISIEDLFEQLSQHLASALPPPFDHLDEYVQFGRRFHSSDGPAARDGNHALAVLIRLRQEAADTVERLLTFLDQTEGQEDVEDDGDGTDAQIRAAGGHDSPWPNDDDEDCGDREPSLGSVNPTISGNGGVWSHLTVDCDYEDEHDGAEPDETDDDTISENSLGWPERDSQRICPDVGGDFSDGHVGE